MVGPWDVAGLPDEWIDACLAATVEMGKWQKLKTEGGIDG